MRILGGVQSGVEEAATQYVAVGQMRERGMWPSQRVGNRDGGGAIAREWKGREGEGGSTPGFGQEEEEDEVGRHAHGQRRVLFAVAGLRCLRRGKHVRWIAERVVRTHWDTPGARRPVPLQGRAPLPRRAVAPLRGAAVSRRRRAWSTSSSVAFSSWSSLSWVILVHIESACTGGRVAACCGSGHDIWRGMCSEASQTGCQGSGKCRKVPETAHASGVRAFGANARSARSHVGPEVGELEEDEAYNASDTNCRDGRRQSSHVARLPMVERVR